MICNDSQTKRSECRAKKVRGPKKVGDFPPEKWVIWSKETESEHAQKVPRLKFGISIIVLNTSLKYLLLSEVNIFHFMKTSLQIIFLDMYKFKVDLKEYFDFA